MISKTGAVLALALALLACVPAYAADASDVGSCYRSQLDGNGIAVYDAVAALGASQDRTLDLTVEFPVPVLQQTRESAEGYAVKTVAAALASLYYESPLLIWLWDLPSKTVDVVPSVDTAVLSGDGKEYFVASSASFSLKAPDKYSSTPVQDVLKEVKDACSGLTYQGNDAEKAKSIFKHLSGVSLKKDDEGAISDIHDAVCAKSSSSAGVAAAFTYMASLNGLDACTVKGMLYDGSEGAIHYWNAVHSAGSWYATDVEAKFVMAGSGTREGGDPFGATHTPNPDLTVHNGLVAPDLAREGYEYPDETPFLQKYGAYILVGLMAVIMVVMLYIGARDGFA
ncbi:MAG: hypothetical protein IKH98_05975 [Candidatus Methanomethylophilaceae archaeon]|nr:hypothetical protein [Candidatus Methanomethylophilaceae archaeon]